MTNDQIPPEIVSLPSGGHGAVRVCRIPSNDPNAAALQFEACQCDAEGRLVLDTAGEHVAAPAYIVTVPRGMIASGQINLDAIIAQGKLKIAKWLEHEIGARKVLDALPAGQPAERARWRLARPDPERE